MKRITQFEYDLIKASWSRNGEWRKLAVLERFERMDTYNHMPLTDRIEQTNNIVKHNIKIRD